MKIDLRKPRLNANGENCPHCDAPNLRQFEAVPQDTQGKAGLITIVECRDCDFAWQWPLHRTTEASAIYFESQYESAATGTYFDPSHKRAVARMEFSFLTSLGITSGDLLDIGCGDGSFLEVAATNGWRATGIDPAATPRVIAPGAEIVAGVVDDLPEAQRFDVVTLWDVIEHLEDPMTVLAAAVQRLKPGGHLILETGNYQSAGRIIGGKSWWNYQADHRWYFGAQTLLEMLQKLGLTKPVLCEHVLRPAWNGSRQYAGPSCLEHVKMALRAPAAARRLLRRYMALREIQSRWPQWSGIEIIAMAARYGRSTR